MKRIAFLLLLFSPIFAGLLIYIYTSRTVVKDSTADESYFGERVNKGARFLRGAIIEIRKQSRIMTVDVGRDLTKDIFVPKSANFFLKLRADSGGDLKEVKGDYLLRLKKGDLVDIELSGDTVFAKKILVYDLQNFSY